MTPWSMRRRFSMYTPEVYTWNDLTHDGLRTSDFKTEDVKEDIDRGYFVRVTKCNC